MNKTLRLVFLIFITQFLVFSLFATAQKEEQGSKKPMLAVSILPQQYFAQRIAQDLVDIVVLVGEGQNPHSYEPSPSQMAQLAMAEAWVLSGTDFELSLTDKITSLYPNLLVVDGTLGIQFRMLEEHDHADESSHEENLLNIDRHTWLGWQSSKIMVTHIKDTLVALLPEHRTVLEQNYQSLLTDIDDTFSELQKQLAPLAGTKVFVYHPSFGYFLDEFSIIQEAVETGGKEPTAKDLSNLIEEAKKDRATAIFVQAQFPVAAARTVAKAVGAEVVSLDPLARDWLANIRLMGSAIHASTKEGK